jgi:hypothetical protein
MFTKTHLAIAVVAAVASMLWTVAFGQPNGPETRAEVKAVTHAAGSGPLIPASESTDARTK